MDIEIIDDRPNKLYCCNDSKKTVHRTVFLKYPQIRDMLIHQIQCNLLYHSFWKFQYLCHRRGSFCQWNS